MTCIKGDPTTLALAGIPTPLEPALYDEIATALDAFLAENALPLNFQVESLEAAGSGIRLRFSGIPGQNVTIECKESLSAPDWTPVESGTFNDDGIFEIIDESPAASCFYHALYE
ncbi:hypothetical protein [Coraliomargarita parva]|uniref:hypothetical protein n=1 Tax=Coraliomargarita parva TaxID=3014050 RepID=UPI0022B2E227|nr:hypothetical protein [Coraliomargarita parva]